MSNIIKKITVKTVLGDVKKMVLGDKKKGVEGLDVKTDVMRVAGIARRMETGESEYGPWVKFKGSFMGTNLITGEEFRAGSAMLPEVASELLEEAMNAEGAENVKFGFDVAVTPDDSIAIGYQYSVTPLIEATEDDPLLSLANSLPNLPKLAAPKKETAKA